MEHFVKMRKFKEQKSALIKKLRILRTMEENRALVDEGVREQKKKNS